MLDIANWRPFAKGRSDCRAAVNSAISVSGLYASKEEKCLYLYSNLEIKKVILLVSKYFIGNKI